MGPALVVVQTLSAALIPVVVRVDSHEPAVIAKALDAGADGVIVPHVQSPEAAGAVAAACRYPPDGSRSWGPTRSSLLGVADTSSANHRVVCIAMLESVAAIERASEIAATPGIDAVLIGSNDLALDMLGPGDSPASVKESEAFERQLALAGAACREAGVVAGAPCLPSMNANRLQEMGFRLLVTPSDAALLRSAAEQAIADIGSERPTDRDLSVPTLGY
jgi:4-hydroxy-2-oxoheptanedioate aldolase